MTVPPGARGDVVVLTAGYKHLPAAYFIQNKALPAFVKLRQNIVEKQYRIFVSLREVQLALGELKRQRRGPRLPLGGKAFCQARRLYLSQDRPCARPSDTSRMQHTALES